MSNYSELHQTEKIDLHWLITKLRKHPRNGGIDKPIKIFHNVWLTTYMYNLPFAEGKTANLCYSGIGIKANVIVNKFGYDNLKFKLEEYLLLNI